MVVSWMTLLRTTLLYEPTLISIPSLPPSLVPRRWWM
jgi:hypothetical protein